ncbi:protein kinase [Streptomyces sp. NPDC028635]|uniref:serine/threonine-protein kinase n=1 Tax=Streptomyces sp. NPDC028635 TaxID=3154800 RepID=UPI0033CD3A0D
MEKLGPGDPHRIGVYRLLARLGAGGMGQVYLARSDRGRTVAVKLVREELAAQEEFRARFRQEVQAARQVGGHWTAPVLDADTEAAVPWVATGYVAGPSLERVVGHDHGALPERSVRILAAGLAHALKDIHAAGIVHRDLKPSNVLVTIDGPRVIDFGIARALETPAREGLTRTGSLVGSPGFMAPEQVRGDRITPACDVFCLGSVLAYAATGTLPFGSATSGAHALMYRIAQEEPDLEGVPEGIADLVRECLRKDPAARPTLDRVLAHTGAEDTVTDGRSRDPWLPGSLVAQLGRHAVRLLDTENPESAGPGTTGAVAAGAVDAPGARGDAGADDGAAPGVPAAPGSAAAGPPRQGAPQATAQDAPRGTPGAGSPGPGGAATPGSGEPGGAHGAGASGSGGAVTPGSGGAGALGPGDAVGAGRAGSGGAGAATSGPGGAATAGSGGVGAAASGPGGAVTPGPGGTAAPGPGGPAGARPTVPGDAPAAVPPAPAGAPPAPAGGPGAAPEHASAAAAPGAPGAPGVPGPRDGVAGPPPPGQPGYLPTMAAGAGGAAARGAGAGAGAATGTPAPAQTPPHGHPQAAHPTPAPHAPHTPSDPHQPGHPPAAYGVPPQPGVQHAQASAAQGPYGGSPGYPQNTVAPAPYGHPHPQPSPAPGAYGYPGQPGGWGGPGYAAPGGGPGATPPYGPPPFGAQEPPRRSGRSTVLLVVIAVIVALAAGGSVYAFMSGGGSAQEPKPSPTTTGPQPSPQPTTDTPSADPSPSAQGGTVPQGYLGTWATTIDNGTGLNTRVLTIRQGEVGDTVLTLVAEGPAGSGTYHCEFTASLSAAPGPNGPLQIGPSTVVTGPATSCSPGAASEVTLLPDGTLERVNTSNGEKLTYTRQS